MRPVGVSREYRMYDKEQLVRYRRASRVNIYNLLTFEDYFYGYMAPDTSWLTCFDLRLYEERVCAGFPDASESGSASGVFSEKKNLAGTERFDGVGNEAWHPDGRRTE